MIYGPEPPTLADKKRVADHERLRKAFPGIDFDETTAIAHEVRHVQMPATAPLTASGEARPHPARRWLIGAHPEHTLRRLDFVACAPPRADT